VQTLLSSHTTGLPPHVPFAHVSFAVQALPSEHEAVLFA
jgi:hypothetical protein